LKFIGGTSLSGEKLQDCISRATTRHREICKLIDKFLDPLVIVSSY
uniref:Uncharacterized protein n=1 Tax=Oncorhynchus tshawytscha TaxID=74940 RepID=A0AAZ3PC92_ONCTS